MLLVLYDKTTSTFDNLGIGILKDFSSEPLITEVLNGLFNLEFDYVRGGWLSESLVEENIIKANGQLFRIRSIKKSLNESKITILAKHIWFDQEKDNFLEDVAPTDKTGTQALEWIFSKAQQPTKFTFKGDSTKIATARYVRMNPIDAIYNADNNLLSRFGGELEIDNFNITLHNKRGKDLGLTIRQRKNLTGADFELDFSTVATRIMPIGKDGIMLPEKYIDSPLLDSYHAPLYYKYEVDIGIDLENNITEEACYEQMRNAVQELFDAGIDKPTITVSIDFVELSKTNEYKDYSSLETAHLGDTCKVYIPKLNLNMTTRIVKTVFNCSKNRITQIELGTPKINYVSNKIDSDNILRNAVSSDNPSSILSQAKDTATSMLNHPFKGYIYISEETGELYLMDTNDIKTAQNIWKFGLGGIGFSSSGVDGPYGVAITQDGQIVADYVTTGQMDVERIKGLSNLIITVENLQENLEDNYYSKKSVDEMIISAEKGVTNTFSEAGGNNIFRNTGLWFEDKDSISEKEVNVKGTLQISDNINKPLKKLTIYGKSEQKTRSGKNRFDYNYVKNYNNTILSTYRFIEIKNLKENTTYTFSGYDLEGIVNFGSSAYLSSLPQQSAIDTKNALYHINSGTKRNQIQFSTDDNGKCYLGIYPQQSNESFWQQFISNFEKAQFEEGTIPTEYEPYGVMPSSEYPSEIKSIPSIENLFNDELEIGGINGSTGLNGSASTRLRTKDYILTNDNIQVLTWKEQDLSCYGFCYDKKYNYLGLINNSWNNTPFIFTPLQNTKYVKFMWKKSNDGSMSANDISDIILEHYLRIDNKSKNEFSGWIKGERLNASTGIIYDEIKGARSDYIPVDFAKNEQYFLSGISDDLYRFVAAYNSKKEFLGRTGASHSKSLNLTLSSFTGAITPRDDNDIAYIIITTYENSNVPGTIDLVDTLQTQLEPGNSATEYESYRNEVTYVNMQGKKLCSTKDLSVRDEFDIISGKGIKRLEETILDGSGSWGSSSSAFRETNDGLHYRIAISIFEDTTIYKAQSSYMCDKFAFKGYNGSLDVTEEGIYNTTSSGANRFFLVINKDKLTDATIDGFKKWLSENPMKVTYELAEPEEFEIEPTEIKTYKGTNNISLVDDLETDLSVIYQLDSPYEFWEGNVKKKSNDKAANSIAMLLQKGTLSQEQIVPSGNYSISFKYKKLIELAEVKVKVNDEEYDLDSLEDKEFFYAIQLDSNRINVEFISDTNNSCEIYDLMVNAGLVKLAYSQNQNETTTDTVNISKGITITSSDTDTIFKANADGIRTLNKNGQVLTQFTDVGMTTKKQIVEDEAEIVGVLVREVGNQVWFSKL